MACSLGAMSAAVHTSAMAASSSVLVCKDTLVLGRRLAPTKSGRLSSFALPSLRAAPFPRSSEGKRALAVACFATGGAIGCGNLKQQRPIVFNSPENSASFGWVQAVEGKTKNKAAPICAAYGDSVVVPKVEEAGFLSTKSLLFFASKARDALQFLWEQPGQLKYIEWPSLHSTIRMAMLTVVVVAFLIIFLATIDSTFSFVLSSILRRVP